MGKRNKLTKSGLSKRYTKNFNNKETTKEENSDNSEISEEIIKTEPKSIRHRRKITKIVLSRGQRRRLKKKEQSGRKRILEEKSKKTNIKEKTLNVKESKSDKFNLGDIDKTILNMLDEISNEKKELRLGSNKKNKKNRVNDEINKIKKIFTNKNFQNNPIESMKLHIKNSLLLKERNKKIDDNFQKEMSKLKK